ncbi:MAG: tRNA glutamyl-Q(34) synthetase GluQRS [Rhizobiaceae bacterium]|jgi:glutamyl-Q tRNA(Asp) synthetase|nr:tRNA glutamyl-Q(34) synthetase GluQRS [Rhizobiaceae bacterium]
MADVPQHVFRFAPSPNGYLHLGHAYSAFLNEALAREAGGRLLLRIEDVDRQRSRPEFAAAIIDDLDWLGIRFDGAIRRQSDHAADHQAALDTLCDLGLVYASVISRRDVQAHAVANPDWPHDPDGAPHVPGEERDMATGAQAELIASGAPHALRLDMGKAVALTGPLSWIEKNDVQAANPRAWGDPVLKSRDGSFAYHLAVVTDDAAQGVTDVVRGRDLFHQTAIHRLLQAVLGLSAPRYHHHDLVLDDAGEKLAKSRNSPSLRDLRAQGVTPDAIRERLGFSAAG